MPQLTKGGKWVFGWSIAGSDQQIPIPPDAWQEYEFEVGQQAIFIRGSQRSGGFSISTPGRWPAAFGPWESASRVLGHTRITDAGKIRVPPEIAIRPGQALLVVRGSGNALGFLIRGPICEKAQQHPELEIFS